MFVVFYFYFVNDFKFMIKGLIFVFDIVKINVGNGYNKIIGVFIVFIFGLYVFIRIVYKVGRVLI